MNRRTHVLLCAVAALSLTIVAPGATAGTADALRLTLTADRPTGAYTLGEPVTLTATLTNAGAAAVEIPELLFDVQSLTVRVAWGAFDGEGFQLVRIHDSVYEPRALTRSIVAPGTSLTATVDFAAMRPGRMTLRAEYRGIVEHRFFPHAVVSNALNLHVAASTDGDTLGVRISTSSGDIDCRLAVDEAPNTCAAFLSLAGRRFFDGLPFHRIARLEGGLGNVVQSGCPFGTGKGGPGFSLPSEFGLTHQAGSLGIARSQAEHSAGSQFYLTTAQEPALDSKYTVFGLARDAASLETIARLAREAAGSAKVTSVRAIAFPSDGPLSVSMHIGNGAAAGRAQQVDVGIANLGNKPVFARKAAAHPASVRLRAVRTDGGRRMETILAGAAGAPRPADAAWPAGEAASVAFTWVPPAAGTWQLIAEYAGWLNRTGAAQTVRYAVDVEVAAGGTPEVSLVSSAGTLVLTVDSTHAADLAARFLALAAAAGGAPGEIEPGEGTLTVTLGGERFAIATAARPTEPGILAGTVVRGTLPAARTPLTGASVAPRTP